MKTFTSGMVGCLYGRRAMMDRHIIGRGVRDPRVLAAMRTVPRESFVRVSAEKQMAEQLRADEGLGNHAAHSWNSLETCNASACWRNSV